MYRYNAYKKFNYKPLPMVEKVAKQCLSLPIYPELSLKYVEFIGKTLNNYE
jgi:dTDP-4-amino-4,6-dideoxygalactose transaminase